MKISELIAQVPTSAGTIEGLGELGMEGGGTDPLTPIAAVISTAIALMTVIAAIYFVFVLISNGISLISGGGDKSALEQARKKITNNLIGLIIAISAIFILSIISTLLGLDNLLDLGTFLTNIQGTTP